MVTCKIGDFHFAREYKNISISEVEWSQRLAKQKYRYFLSDEIHGNKYFPGMCE